MLMLAESFAEQPARAGSFRRTANLATRDDTDSRDFIRRAFEPVQNETTARDAATLRLEAGEVAAELEPALAREQAAR